MLSLVADGRAPAKVDAWADSHCRVSGCEQGDAPRAGLRVLHYLNSPVRGGAEEHALALVTRLGKYGLIPYLAAPSRLLRTMEGELARAGVKSLVVEAGSPFHWREALRLGAALRRERISIVHSHMFAASCFASPVARLAGVPVVVETCHGREAWRQDKWLKGSFWFDRRVGHFVDRYIAVSHASARYLRESKGIPAHKINVIHNGRDLSRFPPPSSQSTGLGLRDEPVILAVARLDQQKGHRFLIDALGRLVHRWPRLLALFIGDGPLESVLKAQRDATGLGRHLRFLGYRADVEKYLAIADLVVLPSLYEGLPLVAIEALGAARPMVATEVDGTPEIIIDGQTGLLVPPGDSAALAAAIERLLNDAALAASLGANGRSFVERYFDIRMQVERTAALYRELAGGAVRGRWSARFFT